jgi:hypothetical protein
MTTVTPEFAGVTPPDHAAEFLNAFRAGQSVASTSPSGNAALDPFTNSITGRLALADQAQMDHAARRAELLEAIGVGLSGVPYSQRPGILAHLAPALDAEGIPAQTVTSFDPTDEALSMSIDRARAAHALLGAG